MILTHLKLIEITQPHCNMFVFIYLYMYINVQISISMYPCIYISIYLYISISILYIYNIYIIPIMSWCFPFPPSIAPVWTSGTRRCCERQLISQSVETQQTRGTCLDDPGTHGFIVSFKRLKGVHQNGGFPWIWPSGKLTVSYWKWPFRVDLPIKNGDFP